MSSPECSEIPEHPKSKILPNYHEGCREKQHKGCDPVSPTWCLNLLRCYRQFLKSSQDGKAPTSRYGEFAPVFPNMQTVMPPTRLQLLRDTQWTSPFTAVTRGQIPSGLPFSMTCLKQVEATFKEQRELTP